MKYQNLTLRHFTQKLSSAEPVPGGGAVGALSCAVASALSVMVIGIALKRKKLAPKKKVLGQIQRDFKRYSQIGFKSLEEDPKAYLQVHRSWNKKGHDTALKQAFEVQRKLASVCQEAVSRNKKLAKIVKGPLANDISVSNHLLKAAFATSYSTALINVKCLKNKSLAKKLNSKLKKLRISR